MNKVATILLLSFLSLLSHAEIKIASDKIPTEFMMLIRHLEQQKMADQDFNKLLDELKKINDHFQGIGKANTMFLFKSEIYRGIVDNQYMLKTEKIQMSENIVKANESRLQKFAAIYTDFSRWIIQALIDDLAPYRGKALLDNYQTIDPSSLDDKQLIPKLKKMLKYLAPWMSIIAKKNPEEFNSLVSKISLDIIAHIQKKSVFLPLHTSLEKTDLTSKLFELPPPKAEQVTSEKSLNAQSQDAAENATKFMNEVNPAPDEEEIDKKLEEITDEGPKEQSSDWQPK